MEERCINIFDLVERNVHNTLSKKREGKLEIVSALMTVNRLLKNKHRIQSMV